MREDASLPPPARISVFTKGNGGVSFFPPTSQIGGSPANTLPPSLPPSLPRAHAPGQTTLAEEEEGREGGKEGGRDEGLPHSYGLSGRKCPAACEAST